VADLLTKEEKLLPLQAAVLNAKGRLCDTQHMLDQWRAQAEAAQRELAMAEMRLAGAQAVLATEE
jgi:hypothetical protein